MKDSYLLEFEILKGIQYLDSCLLQTLMAFGCSVPVISVCHSSSQLKGPKSKVVSTESPLSNPVLFWKDAEPAPMGAPKREVVLPWKPLKTDIAASY